MEHRKPASTPSSETDAVVRNGSREEVSWDRANVVETSVSHVNRFFLQPQKELINELETKQTLGTDQAAK